MRHLFIVDPLEVLQPAGDTSIAFMREAARRGHMVETCRIEQLGQRSDKPFAHARETTLHSNDAHWYNTADLHRKNLSAYDAIWMRKDPPFDMNYLFATYLLSMANRDAEGSGPVMVNDPQALRDENEKLFALEFSDLCPTTLVSRDMEELLEFRDELRGEMIVKPLDGAGGKGIFHITPGDRNARAILETGTLNGSQYLMAQEYIPEVRVGDKRIILVEGEPAGAVLRVPPDDDARANFHAGGQAKKTQLTEREREICARVGPPLRDAGVIFAGIDVIGDYLTEINVTSPTGVLEIKELDNLSLEISVLDAVEARSEQTSSNKSQLEPSNA